MKKKNLAAMLTLVMAMSCITIPAYAASDNSISKVIKVNKTKTLTQSEAPIFYIDADNVFQDDFSFKIKLNGAEWAYDGVTLPDGITCTKITDSWYIFNVDVDVAKPTEKDIAIPLVVKITEKGDIEAVVDGADSYVSSGTYLFAQNLSGGGSIKMSVDGIEDFYYNWDASTYELKNIVISDDSSATVNKSTRYKLKLSNSFRFTDNFEIYGTGKYEDAVRLVTEEGSSEAYIEITKTTPGKSGNIVISGLVIKPSNASSYDNIELTVTIDGQSGSMTIARYKKLSDFATKITLDEIDTSSARPSVSGKGSAAKTVVVYIDDVKLGSVKVGDSEKWGLDYPKDAKDLTDGKHTLRVGYYKSGTEELLYEVTKEFTTKTRDTSRIVISIGSDTFMNNGVQTQLDAPAYIDSNSRTMLPMRAVANALGISDNNIKWDEKAQSVTLKDKMGRSIVIRIGETKLTIDGRDVAIDTSAEIKNSRTMLPMRAMLNAFGISDNAIEWNDTTKTVTITVEK